MPAPFFPAVLLPLLLMALAFGYPWLERWRWHDHRAHQLVQRPRDVPTRTAVGAMAVTFYAVLSLSGANDVIADSFHISLNAMTWADGVNGVDDVDGPRIPVGWLRVAPTTSGAGRYPAFAHLDERCGR